MLKKLFLLITVTVLALSLTLNVAEARRVGGGRSVGVQRQVAPPQRQVTPPQAPAARPAPAATPTPAPVAQSGWRRFLGPLAGLATAFGLAALLSHFGISSQFAGILLLVIGVVAVFALLRWLFAARRPQPAYAGPQTYTQDTLDEPLHSSASREGVATPTFPPGFDAEVFARQAKLNFIRLQAANDSCDLADIREFTSPEIFAEIKLEIDERGGAKQQTDVVMLEAEVLEVVEDNRQYIASVRYWGKLREDSGAPPQSFDEIWHLTKPTDGNRGWVLAGIQQVA